MIQGLPSQLVFLHKKNKRYSKFLWNITKWCNKEADQMTNNYPKAVHFRKYSNQSCYILKKKLLIMFFNDWSDRFLKLHKNHTPINFLAYLFYKIESKSYISRVTKKDTNVFINSKVLHLVSILHNKWFKLILINLNGGI